MGLKTLVITRSSLAILYGPSAYASGALVKCRKVGAANWGNKSEEFEMQEKTDPILVVLLLVARSFLLRQLMIPSKVQ